MPRWILAVLAATLLTTPAEARLSPVTQASKDIAMRVWVQPCGGVVHIRRDYFADYRNGGVDYRIAAMAFTDDGPCRIVINRALRFTPAALCTVVLHEVGHVAGYRAAPGTEFIYPDGTLDREHSANRRSVMFPFFRRVDPRCRPIGRRFRIKPY